MRNSFLARVSVFAMALGLAGVVHAEDTLKKIKDTGVVTEGVRESSGALAFTLGDGKYTGFHYDVCPHIIADIQKQLGMAKIDAKYQPVTSRNRIPQVQDGTIDLECGSTTNSVERQKDVAFAPTLYVEQVRIAVKKNSRHQAARRPRRQDDLHDVRHHLGAAAAQVQERRRPTSRNSTARTTPSRSCCCRGPHRRVRDGRHPAAGLIANSRNPADYMIIGESLRTEPYSMMLRKDDPAFKELVDDSVRVMKSGEINKIYAKWFTSRSRRRTQLGFPATRRSRKPSPTRTTRARVYAGPST